MVEVRVFIFGIVEKWGRRKRRECRCFFVLFLGMDVDWNDFSGKGSYTWFGFSGREKDVWEKRHVSIGTHFVYQNFDSSVKWSDGSDLI